MGAAAANGTKTRQKTWLDLLPPGAPEIPTDDLLTRQELLQELRDRGVDVSEVALVYWEKAGVLPRSIRRRRHGAPRSLYPHYAVDAVAHLRELQAAGRNLDQIAPLMRAWALAPVAWQDPYARPLTNARAALAELARALNVDAATIRVSFANDAGEEVWRHEIPIPAEGA